MIVLCIRCGRSLQRGEKCCADKPSNLERVVFTAACCGVVTDQTIRAAVRALKEQPS